jgi:hypothetical protein
VAPRDARHRGDLLVGAAVQASQAGHGNPDTTRPATRSAPDATASPWRRYLRSPGPPVPGSPPHELQVAPGGRPRDVGRDLLLRDHVGSASPACSRTMYSAYQSGQTMVSPSRPERCRARGPHGGLCTG